jgi:hypothetical protein
VAHAMSTARHRNQMPAISQPKDRDRRPRCGPGGDKACVIGRPKSMYPSRSCDRDPCLQRSAGQRERLALYHHVPVPYHRRNDRFAVAPVLNGTRITIPSAAGLTFANIFSSRPVKREIMTADMVAGLSSAAQIIGVEQSLLGALGTRGEK